MTDIAVIIVNWNGKEHLKTCLNSLFNQSYKSFDTIMVDNGSTDNSIDFVKKEFPYVKVISLDKNHGFAKANNIGIRHALKNGNANYIALLNNDTKIDPEWLTNLEKVGSSNNRVGSCQSKMLSFNIPEIIDAVGISFDKCGLAVQIGSGEKDTGQYEDCTEVFGACAGAALYRSEMLIQVGLFDENFFAYYEDVDLALRSRLANWRCLYVPSAIVYHKQSSTLGKKSPVKAYFRERNVYYYIVKNMPRSIISRFLLNRPVRILRIILSILKRLILEDIKGIKYSLSCLKGNFFGVLSVPKIIGERHRVRVLSVISDDELVKSFSKSDLPITLESSEIR